MMRLKRVLLPLLCVLFLQQAFSQFYYFGRNKVQYTDFRWRILKTEHFDIYYYPEMKELAERGAWFAEEGYRVLEQKFNHTVAQRIPLIFYSSHLHFQQTNVTPGFIPEGVGGFFEFLKGRVVIPSNGSTSQFAHVIRHELVHVFMHSKISRVLVDHRQPQDRLPPLWFTEGLAEYWSTEWDTQAEMVMRDAVLNNTVVGLSEIEWIYGSFLLYKEGQAALEYIAQQYGDHAILLLMENFWRSASFSDVMKATIGKTYEEFDREWLYALKKRYYPLLAESDLPSRTAETVVEKGFNAKPVIHTHNGTTWVYFLGNYTGYSGVYRVPLGAKDAEPERMIEGERSHEFEAFHPFQTKIDISRDGRLAFVTKSGENDVLHLYDVHADRLVETLRFDELVMLGSPSWSPDGGQLVFSSIDKSGNNDLYLYTAASGELRKLTNDFYDDRDPAWSPDGSRIAFSSDRTPFGDRGRYNLFLYDLRTSRLHYLTQGDQNDLSPSWSASGAWLAFTSDREGAMNVWVMPIDTGATEIRTPWRSIRRVTDFYTAAFDPSWEGDHGLVFTVFEQFSFQIRTMRDALSRSEKEEVFTYDVEAVPWEASRLEGSSIIGNLPYTGEYSLDVAQTQISTDPVFGTAGGAALAMSDILGNDVYYFVVYNTAQAQSELLDSFNFLVSRISLGTRANHSYGIFRFAGNRYDLTDPDIFYYERSFGGFFALSYPISKFRRIEASVTLSNSEKDNYLNELPRRALLVTNGLSFVWDNSLWGPTGPLDGNRMKLTLAYTTDVQYSNVAYYTVIADYRKYVRLGTRTALASRAHLWFNEGKETRRFFMGGSWDLRGWPRWSIRGQKLWLTSHELRFPFVDELGLRFPFGGIRFGSIRGAIFADAGSAWDVRYRDTKGSVGAGIRFNLGGFLVLRYDIGKRIERNFSVFQKGLFYQFFFGWDF